MAQISVIVPVYNEETFLKECIESIQSQTFRNFEIILVDDGSTNSAGNICDELEKKYNNISVVHQKNTGANKARANGVLNYAKGNWICFVDSDDTLLPTALEKMIQHSMNSDIVIFCPSDKLPKNLEECRIAAINGSLFSPAPHAKLYKRELFSTFTFDIPKELNYGEDMIMNIRLMFTTKTMPSFFHDKVYEYRRNLYSISHTKVPSLEYESLFDKHRNLSIPQTEITRYMPAIIKIKINGLYGIAFRNPLSIIHDPNNYIVNLNKEIQYYSYKINLKEKILLSTKSKILLKGIGLCELLKRTIKYRVGIK